MDISLPVGGTKKLTVSFVDSAGNPTTTGIPHPHFALERILRNMLVLIVACRGYLQKSYFRRRSERFILAPFAQLRIRL